MKITLLVVGKTTDARLDALITEYRNRLSHYIPFDFRVIPDLKNAKSLTQDQQKQAEGELILREVGTTSHVVLLDEHGREYRSIAFAAYLQKIMNNSGPLPLMGKGCPEGGKGALYFIVGGPYGFSPSVYARANGKISLSQMTFSHQMIRLLFVEQIYRAMTILRGEPYHHE